MVCKVCGRELADTDRFCIECGTVVQAQIQDYTGRTTVKRKKKLWVPILAVIVALVIAAAALLPGILIGDAAKLLKAAFKSWNAWRECSVMDLQAVAELAEQREFTGEYQLWLEDLPEQAQLEGFGIRAALDFSRPQDRFGLVLAPTYGYADLLQAKMLLQGKEMYLGSPELSKDVWYLLHADRLSQDLQALGYDTTKIDTVCNNAVLFWRSLKNVAANTLTAVGNLGNTVLEYKDQLSVTDGGKEEIQVNGNSLKAQRYEIVIPKQVVSAVVDVAEKLYLDQNSSQMLLELCRSLDMGRKDLETLENDLLNAEDRHEAVFERIRKAVEAQGDMNLQVHISGGYLVRLAFSLKVENAVVDVAAELGGGKYYVDDLSVKASTADIKLLELTSKGSHRAKDGVYTDRSRLTVLGNEIFLWDLRYVQASDRDDFSWTVHLGDTSIKMDGWVNPGKHEFAVHLSEINLVKAGQDLGTCGMELRLGLYLPEQMDTSNHIVLSEMTKEARTAASLDVMGNITEWLGWVRENFPELVSMLTF